MQDLKPSITIPPNFPDTVTLTPGEEPYPEQPTDEGPQQEIPPMIPSWEPPRQPEIGLITPEPPRLAL